MWRTARWAGEARVFLLVLLIPFGPARLLAEDQSDLERARLVITGARQISEETLRRAMKKAITDLHG